MSNRTISIIVAAGVLAGIGLLLVLRSTSSDTEAVQATTSTTTTPMTTSDPTTTTTSAVDEGFPVTVDAPNGPVTIDERPTRIVSISPTSTEVLFAVGAGGQVIAVDDQSNFPAEAPVTDISGFTPNVEAIAALDPDLVFLSFDPGDVIAGLEAVGIPVILHGSALSLDEAYAQWEQVGVATGNIAEAVALVASTQESIASAVASLPGDTNGLSYYYELDPTFYSATSSTFVGELFALTAMTNIADEGDPDGFGFPQLTSEYIVDSDPSLIYLADTKCCGQNEQEVAARPGWNSMTAVSEGTVIELDDDVASRWGPRITQLLDIVVASILDLDLVDA
ncbi:MAG: ABC transporter substrate-binding protein [Acidimicrobiia bacterium]|nr:MAG: ABC transporter substrate-binding protein [Acidimicrobiia bacterium]